MTAPLPGRDHHPAEPLARLLCAADLHLGKRPPRLPAELEEMPPAGNLSPAEAWRRLVQFAVSERVDAVLLAGDVVEGESDFYEAYSDLRAGAEELARSGIQLIAVAGNHDLEVLPRLADVVKGVRLLGRNGTWERTELATAEGPISIVGWSFPQRTGLASPFGGQLPGRRGVATIGLLHCDVDGGSPRYAPVSRAELEAAPVDAWLLGHIHQPSALSGDRPIGYLGSLTGLDPSETGPRGACLLEVRSGGGLAIERVSLAPLRWEEIGVEVDGMVHANEVHGRLLEALHAVDDRLSSAGTFTPIAVGVRMVLCGRSRLGKELRRELEETDPRAQVFTPSTISYFIHDLRFRVSPQIELEELALGSDPLGLLARRVLLLRSADPGGELGELLAAARRRLEPVGRRSQFRELPSRELDDERVRELLEDAALGILDELLAQKERAA